MSTLSRVTLSTGIEVEYEEAGDGNRAFVLVHGFTGSRDDWREHISELAKSSRVIALDLRGHGGSTNTGDLQSYTLDQLALDLDAFLEKLALGPCDLLGHSLGGMVALRLTLAQPERVASLILMDSAARGLPQMPRALIEAGAAVARNAGMPTFAKLLREDARKHDRPTGAARRPVDAMGFDPWWDRIQRKYETMDPEAFAALGTALSEQEPVSHRIGEINCPTTVIVGEEDLPFLPCAEELESGIRDAVRCVIPDAAHSPQLENPERWMEAIRMHLERARA